MIRDGLTRFADANLGIGAARVVVWFEPEHEHCGLYISVDGDTPNLLPAEFEFPNFAVADANVGKDYDERRSEFHAEVEELIRSISRQLSEPVSPKLWGVQVAFDYYNEWRRGEANDV